MGRMTTTQMVRTSKANAEKYSNQKVALIQTLQDKVDEAARLIDQVSNTIIAECLPLGHTEADESWSLLVKLSGLLSATSTGTALGLSDRQIVARDAAFKEGWANGLRGNDLGALMREAEKKAA